MKKLEREAERLIKKTEQEALKAVKRSEREAKKAEREALKAVPKEQKPAPTEAELALKYANTIITNQRNRGQLTQKFQKFAIKKTNKDLWLDSDFFFSVVFQSREQKVQFLHALALQLGMDVESFFQTEYTSQIINGLQLADKMNIPLEGEFTKDYPLPNMELRELVLDDSEF